jgi:IS5 family transposase
MKLLKENQMTFLKYDLDLLVRKNHKLRKVESLISFLIIAKTFSKLAKGLGRKGYGIEIGIRCLFLQFFYDLSDRQLEERLSDDISFRWFCGFSINDKTPDHTYFCRIRNLLGTKNIGRIFDMINEKSKQNGILRSVFTFVDAQAVKVKETTWAERDKAIKEGEEALNNQNIKKYSADKDARFGCKGKNKFWFGFKRHTSVDMGSGLIKKTAITSANVPDQKGIKHICPDGGMVFADKSYCLKEAQTIMKKKGCHSGAIKKNNMKSKNKDKDKWISSLRSPCESTFSKLKNRARYKGITKVQLQNFMESIAFNIKRLITINAPPLFAGA